MKLEDTLLNEVSQNKYKHRMISSISGIQNNRIWEFNVFARGCLNHPYLHCTQDRRKETEGKEEEDGKQSWWGLWVDKGQGLQYIGGAAE